jgi:hypothetical protein
MDDLLSDIAYAPQGSPFAKGLNLLLIVAMIILIITCLGMVIFGVCMFFDNSLKEMFFAELEATNTTPSAQKLGLVFIAAAFMTIGYIFVVHMLRKIVGTLIAGDPFVPANISRLRSVWIVIAICEFFRMIFRSVLSIEINALNVSETVTSSIDIRLGTWFLVFVIAALAEVFRHGAVLRRDQELTV